MNGRDGIGAAIDHQSALILTAGPPAGLNPANLWCLLPVNPSYR
jgi:hypothetical protein